MERRKLVSAALFLTIFGAMLFTPPLTQLFDVRTLLFGAPVQLIYLFTAWLLLALASWWLGRRLPHDPPASGEDAE
ncbi:hypothetical protein [Devosia sp.]|uniref:hypothetical protein n=1 Tax=Devosia sp. TaxID=1871048 RepID=UPI003A925A36